MSAAVTPLVAEGFDKLFTGIAVETPPWVKSDAAPTGAEGIGPEDTFDGGTTEGCWTGPTRNA